jgi:hypothetical protein
VRAAEAAHHPQYVFDDSSTEQPRQNAVPQS